MSDAVLRRRAGAVQVLVNNNPAARNAITLGFYDAMSAGIADAQTRLGDGRARSTARIKVLCRQAHRATLEQQLESEALHMVDSIGDDEAREGIAAFFGKHATNYRGLRRNGF